MKAKSDLLATSPIFWKLLVLSGESQAFGAKWADGGRANPLGARRRDTWCMVGAFAKSAPRILQVARSSLPVRADLSCPPEFL
jgi:hypothetical protein